MLADVLSSLTRSSCPGSGSHAAIGPLCTHKSRFERKTSKQFFEVPLRMRFDPWHSQLMGARTEEHDLRTGRIMWWSLVAICAVGPSFYVVKHDLVAVVLPIV